MARLPVLICGGGPVGLAVALDLGWRGVPCLLVEQGDGERVQPKMLFVSVRSMEICRRWGVEDRVRNWGFPDDFPHDNVFVTTLAGHEIARLPSPAFRDRKPLPVSPTSPERAAAHRRRGRGGPPGPLHGPGTGRADELRGLLLLR